MASARKKVPANRGRSSVALHRAFIDGLLDGSIQATQLHRGQHADGTPDLEYDDPHGNGQGQGNQSQGRASAGRRPT